MRLLSTLRPAIATIALIFVATPAWPQTVATTRVTRQTVVREQPRGDSARVVTVSEGQVLEVHDQNGAWFLVSPPAADAPTAKWVRGWIHASFVEPPSGMPAQPSSTRSPGRLKIRAFGQTGGTLFAARDSFDTILGSAFGLVSGGGAQVVLPNSAFVQVSFEQFRETGTRALVSGDQVFTLDTPATVTVRPITVTLGYVAPNYGRFGPYLGAGVGWHMMTEDSPSVTADQTKQNKIGYHVVGGSEFALVRWVSVAGEIQWTAVPKALGETGVSAAFGEDDLGGTTFRFKFIVGY